MKKSVRLIFMICSTGILLQFTSCGVNHASGSSSVLLNPVILSPALNSIFFMADDQDEVENKDMDEERYSSESTTLSNK